MNRMRSAVATFALATVVAFVGAAAADDDRPPPPHPPPEALAACDAKADGDACTVTLRDGTHAGTCHAPPGKRLACVPKDLPPPPPPPQDG